MGDHGVEDQNAALAPQSCTATRTQRQDQGSSVCRACCPSTLWTGRWGAPCWYLAATRSKQGFSIVTLTGLVSLAGTSVCLDQATLSRVENVLCHCSPPWKRAGATRTGPGRPMAPRGSSVRGEEHFQTGGADRRTKTIDLMSCKAQVAKCQTVHIFKFHYYHQCTQEGIEWH